MKTNFKTLIALTLVSSVSLPVHAYKFVIYTDEPVISKKSEQVAELLKTTYPFNQFKIDVEIVKLKAEDLQCESTNGIDRLVTCPGSDGIQNMAMRAGGDQAMIVKHMDKWGGSAAVGGGVPVITTGTSARAMLHEYMHTLGLCDEYEYKKEEAGFYCSRGIPTPNTTFIKPQEPYAGDHAARAAHSSQIPWYGDILSTTDITTAGINLGTGKVDFGKKAAPNSSSVGEILASPTGLFRGKVCDLADPPVPSWHPSGVSTIMDNVDAGLGAPLEKIVEKTLISKGFRKKMELDQPREQKPRVVDYPSQNEAGGTIAINPQQSEQVNDTGRNFFKSFFQWLTELFQSIGNTFTR